MNLQSKMITGGAGVVALTLVCSLAQAAPVTITDPNSDFSVTYDDQETGLFGTPILNNNTIFFIPNNFFAESLNGAGTALTNDTIQLILTAETPGFSLDSFQLEERGDYLLNGPTASVDVQGQMVVFDTSAPFDEFDEFIQTTSDMTINDGNLHNWEAAALIDGMDGWMGAEQVVLTLENILIAQTNPGDSSAFVEKKFEGVAIIVNPVPVPPALWLLGSAIMGIATMRRRTKN